MTFAFTTGNTLTSTQDYIDLGITIPVDGTDYSAINSWFSQVIDVGYSHEFINELISALKGYPFPDILNSNYIQTNLTTPSPTLTPSSTSTPSATHSGTPSATQTPLEIFLWTNAGIKYLDDNNLLGLYGNPSIGDIFTHGNLLSTTQDYLDLGLHLPVDENDYINSYNWYNVVILNNFSHEKISQLIAALNSSTLPDIHQFLSINYISNTYSTPTPTSTPFYPVYVFTSSGIDFLTNNGILSLFGENRVVNDIFTTGDTLPSTQDYLNLGVSLPSNQFDFVNINNWYNIIRNKSDEFIAELISSLQGVSLTNHLNQNYIFTGYIKLLDVFPYVWTQTGIDALISNNQIGLYANPVAGDTFTSGGILPTPQDYLNLGISLPTDMNNFSQINIWFSQVIDIW